MTISKELKEKAQKLGRKHNVQKVWVNVSGEVFTEEQFAKASVKGDKDKYSPVEVTAEVKKDAKGTNDLGNVQEVLDAVDAAETAEAVQAILDAEKTGKNRVTVLTAASKKIETLNK